MNILKITIILCISLQSCDTHRNQIKSLISHWRNKQIVFPDSLIDAKQDSVLNKLLNKEFKILTIVDSLSCKSCKLRLYEWKKLIIEADSIFNSLSFIFVVHSNNYEEIDHIIKNNKFDYPIIYDRKNQIGKLNNFPQQSNFQTFLINKNNQVILLGNPINNKKVWTLYKEVISDSTKYYPSS